MNGLVQDFSNSIANAQELLQSCIKPSMSLYVIQGIPAADSYYSRRAWYYNLAHGLVQDCNNSIANTQGLLQSCIKPLMSLYVIQGIPAADSYYSRRAWYYNLAHGLVQDCNNSIANTQELLQSCIKPLMSLYVIQGIPAAGSYSPHRA